MEECELIKCPNRDEGTILVYDNCGDEAWATMICEKCAEQLNMEDGDTLPEVDDR